MSSGPTKKIPKIYITDNTQAHNPRFRKVDEPEVNPIPKRATSSIGKVLNKIPIIGILNLTSMFIPKPFRPMLTWLKERLTEKSTYQGVIGLSAAAGVSMNPEMLEAVIALAVSLISVIEIMRKENGKEETSK